MVLVELDVFSGRPNPTWELSAEEGTALARLMADLPSGVAPPSEGRLGYRGFVLFNPAGEPGFPARVRVGGGVVVVEQEDGREVYLADVHGLEHRLLDLASQHGFRRLVEG